MSTPAEQLSLEYFSEEKGLSSLSINTCPTWKLLEALEVFWYKTDSFTSIYEPSLNITPHSIHFIRVYHEKITLPLGKKTYEKLIENIKADCAPTLPLKNASHFGLLVNLKKTFFFISSFNFGFIKPVLLLSNFSNVIFLNNLHTLYQLDLKITPNEFVRAYHNLVDNNLDLVLAHLTRFSLRLGSQGNSPVMDAYAKLAKKNPQCYEKNIIGAYAQLLLSSIMKSSALIFVNLSGIDDYLKEYHFSGLSPQKQETVTCFKMNLADLRTNLISKLIRYLSSFFALTSLDLSHIHDKHLKPLLMLLNEPFKLRILHLNNNHIGDSLGAQLVTLLKNNTSLTSLNLDTNSLGSLFINALLSVLGSGNRHLAELNLCNNDLEDEHILQLLPYLSQFTSLNLAKNLHSITTINQFLSSLLSDKCPLQLKYLNLSLSSDKEKTNPANKELFMAQLIQVVTTNKSLQSLLFNFVLTTNDLFLYSRFLETRILLNFKKIELSLFVSNLPSELEKDKTKKNINNQLNQKNNLIKQGYLTHTTNWVYVVLHIAFEKTLYNKPKSIYNDTMVWALPIICKYLFKNPCSISFNYPRFVKTIFFKSHMPSHNSHKRKNSELGSESEQQNSEPGSGNEHEQKNQSSGTGMSMSMSMSKKT